MVRILVVALAMGGLAGSAFAEPGDHIRAGNLEITPSVDIGGEYRTNVYRDEAEPTDGFYLRVAPALSAIADTDEHTFGIAGAWELRKYLYLGAPNTDVQVDPISDALPALDTYTDFGVSADLNLFKKSSVGFVIGNVAQLRNVSSDAEFSRTPFTSHFRDSLNAGIRISPASALQIVPGGHYGYDYYWIVERNADRQYNAKNEYGPTLNVSYDFLPRTSAVLRSSLIWHQWKETSVATLGGGFGNFIGMPNSLHGKVEVGMDGQITERISTTLLVGYGLAGYDEDSIENPEALDAEDVAADLGGLQSLLITADVKYAIAEELFLGVAYNRSFEDSWFTNFVNYDQIGASLDGKVGRLHPSLGYTIRFENFTGETNRSDVVNRVNAGLGVDVSKWAQINAGALWQQRASDDTNVEYDDLKIHGMLTLQY